MQAAETRLSDCWRRCVRDPSNAIAWEDLLRFHRPLLAGIACRVASRWGTPHREDVDEVVQEICMKLSSHARSGAVRDAGDSVLEAYLKALAANTASDFFRSRKALRRDGGHPVSIDQVSFQLRSQLGRESLDSSVLMEQINAFLAAEASLKERTIFFLYYKQGLTAKEIAAVPGLQLSVKGVESQLQRTTTWIRKRMSGDEGFAAGGPS